VVVHPSLLKNLLEAYKNLHIPEHEAKKRIILATWNESFDNLPSGYIHISDLLTSGRLDEEACFDGRYAHETALICYSSGTTGLAKGVEVRINVT
jgi:4-coumarate--CoA ligase